VKFSQRLLVGTLKGITSLICRIDDQQLSGVPMAGPLIIYTNHVNILEIPIIYTRLQPRRVHGLLLAERWNNALLRPILNISETIPLHRGVVDLTAIHAALDLLARGEMIVIAPEGTRSHDGRLQQAHPGVVLLALHSRAPLLPLAFYGAEAYRENLSQLKRSDFHIRVGSPFTLDPGGEKVTRQVRQGMVDEMMYQLADFLPEKYLGRYMDAVGTSPKYLTLD
jgi:1-acyl-sn-glycerol-3-phosphate acyltransferase